MGTKGKDTIDVYADPHVCPAKLGAASVNSENDFELPDHLAMCVYPETSKNVIDVDGCVS